MSRVLQGLSPIARVDEPSTLPVRRFLTASTGGAASRDQRHARRVVAGRRPLAELPVPHSDAGYGPGSVLFIEEMAALKSGDPFRSRTFRQLV